MKKIIFNLKTLHEQVDLATLHATNHAGRVASYKARVRALRQDVEDSLAILDGPARAAAEKIYQPDLTKRIIALRAETSTARWHFPREIEAIRAAALEAKNILTTPIQIATVANLGSEKRTNYERTVSGLGPRALATFATQARLTGDKELASALILENDKLPTQDRVLSSKKLADDLFSTECDEAQTLYAALELSFDRSMALLRDSEGRKLSPVEQLTSGMKHPGIRLVPDDDDSDEIESDNRTPAQQLSDGMAQR